ncbi:DUF58 domain-containing protein [Gryllotalpicola ginsengisoli]|uniref:DUF58 domain-containing protein n=1 Tax=Gryllotalpicola ginsengisoli TaxID=444608 RepID=UPI0003B406E7|nr:DUF58 domain-containing protein [Gryllotalpicola ginsengisoli]
MTIDQTGTTGGTISGTATGTATHFTREQWSTRARIAVWAVRSWREIQSAATSFWKRVSDTVTPVGWLALFAVVVLLPVGLELGWIELVLAGLISAAVLLIAIPFLAGTLAYSVDFGLPVDRVVAGSVVTGELKVTNTSRHLELPGRIDVPVGAGLTDLWVPLLRPGHSHAEQVVIPAHRRGIIDVGPVTTVRTDPLGTLKREASWAEVHRLFVHPKTVSIPSTSSGFVRDLEGTPTRDIAAEDISFHQIREYQPGDGQRHIHWKSTAKTGELMVREFEETRRSRLAIVLGMHEGEFADDDEYELAVSVAGSLGVRAIRDGRDVAVLASDQILDVARRSVRAMQSLTVTTPNALLDDLATVERSPYAMAFEEVCDLATQAMSDLSIVFVLCGSNVERQRLSQLTLHFPPGVQVVAVIANPGAEPGFRWLGRIGVFTVAVLDDFRHLLRRAGV